MIKCDESGGKKICIYNKGQATVTYKDQQVAQSAISIFNKKIFNGNVIRVGMTEGPSEVAGLMAEKVREPLASCL